METVTAGGAALPALGLGTARLTGEDCREAVATALELGYRHVDTAQSYDNERAVGAGVRAADVPRDAVTITTKVSSSNLSFDEVERSVAESLDRLGTTIDLLLIHQPGDDVPISETIAAMNEWQARGDVDHVGVSNFSVDQLETAIEASRTPIVTNQVEYNPYVDCAALHFVCREHDVALTAYSPLAKGRVLEEETLASIGTRHGKTAAQVALRWLVQQDGVLAIPKASGPAHLAENLAVFDFALSDDEMRDIAALQEGLTDRVLGALGLG